MQALRSRSRAFFLVPIVAALALGATHLLAAEPRDADPLVVRQDKALLHDARSPTLGDPKGDVTLIEFFDYACPTCRATEPRIDALLRSDPRVRIIAKEYPMLSPQSLIAARAALAAARQDHYAAYHQALLNYRGPLTEAVIFGVAREMKLDLTQLRRDMASPAIAAEIQANLALGRAIRAPGTPTLVAGGRILKQSSTDIDFSRLVASLRVHRS
ncbi:MAG: thioredoxin domain-containing protein [Caulobacteraceae bacterium]